MSEIEPTPFYPGRADGESYQEVMDEAEMLFSLMEAGHYSNPEVVAAHIEKLFDFADRLM